MENMMLTAEVQQNSNEV